MKKTILMPTQPRVKNAQWFLHLSVIPAIYFATPGYLLITLITFWLVHGFGSAIGAHRYFVHRTFKTNRVWEIIFAFLFTISCTGSVLGYVMIHKKHHAHSDGELDPHNPALGFWKTWWGMYDEKKLTFGPKMYLSLLNDPVIKFFHQYYFAIIAAYLLVLALIDPVLIIFMFCLPAIMQFQVNAILIALVHSERAELVGGYRSYETNDNSYNIWWLKPITLGEELHNNHHAKPACVTMDQGHGWRDFDPLYYVIKYVIRGDINEISAPVR